MNGSPRVPDPDSMPELARLAQEVTSSRHTRALRRNGAELAVLSRVRPRPRRLKRKAVTREDIEAALSVAGAWKDWMNPEEFKRERRALQVHER